jgi:choline dehydrogenase
VPRSKSVCASGRIRPVLDRPNLTVAVNSQATQILFDGTRASGVAYVRDGVANTARAQIEVILSGGTINSPQLLLLSGIGPAEQLRAPAFPSAWTCRVLGQICRITR